jgi:dephospho-CoA kinase
VLFANENMLLVGLTGGISTGKSTVSKYLIQNGVPVIDADEIARAVVAPGTNGYRYVRKEFGGAFFEDHDGAEGPLKRDKLNDLVFNDAQKRRKLNQLLHPEILKALIWQLVLHFVKGHRFVVLDVPLLFETGMHRFMQKNVVVTCDFDVQISRLMSRDNWSKEEAERRISAQMPMGEKCAKANVVIDNNGSVEDTYRQVDLLLKELRSSWSPFFIRIGLFSVFSSAFLIVLKVLHLF